MEFREFYEKVGGDYDEVIGRLGKEERITKYLHKFVESDPIAEFDKALQNDSFEECFRALHSIKGMCLNLGLGKLSESSSALCEEYRNGAPTKDVTLLTKQVRDDYAMTLDVIKEL